MYFSRALGGNLGGNYGYFLYSPTSYVNTFIYIYNTHTVGEDMPSENLPQSKCELGKSIVIRFDYE